MTTNIQLSITKKYLGLIPILFFLLIFSGVIGIIAISLNSPNQTATIQDTTDLLQPGTFDTITLYFQDNKQDIVININLITLIDKEIPKIGIAKDIFIFNSKPNFSFGNNFSMLKESEDFSDNLLDQDYDVDYVSQLYIQNNKFNVPLYLVIVNPEENTENIQVETSVVINNTTNDAQVNWVLSLVAVSLYTFAMLMLTIISAVEVVEPKGYHSRILTKELDERINQLIVSAESWEITILVLAFIMLPIGIAMNFANIDTPMIFFSIGGFIVVYININKRIEFHSSIKSLLINQKQISSSNLSLQLKKAEEDVKKAVYYLISHQRFPIQFNAKTNIITYMGEQTSSDIKKEIKVNRTEVETIASGIDISCAYCGVEAIIPSAKFCADCGASMMPSK